MQWIFDKWLIPLLGGGRVALRIVSHGRSGRDEVTAPGSGRACDSDELLPAGTTRR